MKAKPIVKRAPSRMNVLRPPSGVTSAPHIANRELVLRIVLWAPSPRQYIGEPVVATDDKGGWFAGELIDRDDKGDFVIAAVNLYGTEAEARRWAERWGIGA